MPDAVKTPLLPPDYHVHTALCKHAEGDPPDYKRAAAAKGLTELGFADHIPTPDRYDVNNRMRLDEFPTYRQMIRAIVDSEPPAILFGIEADYYEGCERFLREWLPPQRFDYVLGSIHYIEQWGFDSPSEASVWRSVDVTAVWRSYFELLGKLAQSGLYDIVGHIDVPKKFGYRPPDNRLREMALPTLDQIAEAGMGIEINTGGLRKPVGEMYPSPLLLSRAWERQIPICFGSDSHRPAEVGADFDKAVRMAREAGYAEFVRFRNRRRFAAPLSETANR